MANPVPKADELVTAAYTIPSSWKARIERTAKELDLSASQVVRRIFADHFSRIDAENAQPNPQPATAA